MKMATYEQGSGQTIPLFVVRVLFNDVNQKSDKLSQSVRTQSCQSSFPFGLPICQYSSLSCHQPPTVWCKSGNLPSSPQPPSLCCPPVLSRLPHWPPSHLSGLPSPNHMTAGGHLAKLDYHRIHGDQVLTFRRGFNKNYSLVMLIASRQL